NVRFQAKSGTPIGRAVENTYTDSVLMALRIRAVNQMRQGVVIDLNDVFFTDFAQLGLGMLDPERTTWNKVKAFPRNLELQVTATFAGGRFGPYFPGGGDDSVIDARGTTMVIHYSLVEMPDPGYVPRLADDRVGYFLTAQ